jgi:hypothetical protein
MRNDSNFWAAVRLVGKWGSIVIGVLVVAAIMLFWEISRNAKALPPTPETIIFLAFKWIGFVGALSALLLFVLWKIKVSRNKRNGNTEVEEAEEENDRGKKRKGTHGDVMKLFCEDKKEQADSLLESGEKLEKAGAKLKKAREDEGQSLRQEKKNLVVKGENLIVRIRQWRMERRLPREKTWEEKHRYKIVLAVFALFLVALLLLGRM